MKKILLFITISITLLLTGCIPVEDGSEFKINSEEELIALIEALMPEAEITTSYDLSSFENAITDMVYKVRTGIIGIIANTSLGTGTGSGVVYKQVGNLYYVVTNQHVIEGANSLVVVYEKNGLLFEIASENITLLGSDTTTDLAVLTFTSEESFEVIPLADSYTIELGQFVFAIGNPLGFEYYGTVTMGIISGIARYVGDGVFNATLLQHDAALSPGNSGGALLNLKGELIGINNMKLVDDLVTGIGFAIPSNTVRRITADLEDDGLVTRPFLGISTYATVNLCGMDYGVCAEITSGGAADAAGLLNGDVIIGYKNSSMDDFLDILNFNELREAILNSSVGETVQIKYVRDGVEYISLEATLNVHPDDLWQLD